MEYEINVNGQFDYHIERDEKGLLVNDLPANIDIIQINTSSYHILDHFKSYHTEVVNFDAAKKTAEIKVNNNIYTISVKDRFDVLLDQLGLSSLNTVRISDIKAPMPGLVLKVLVNEGDEVKKGENLFVLEAMKMENMIKAPADVRIKSVKLKPGDKVEKGQVLMIFA
jgi:biotin carboxyl carrier protein